MNKTISLLLVLVLCLSLCACGKSASSEATNTPIVTQDTSPNVLPEETTVPVETEPETTAPAEEPFILEDVNGEKFFNLKKLPEITECVELTTENWSEYIKVYSFDEVIVEKDAFGDVVSEEIKTHYRLGAGNERYNTFDDTVIELKDTTTGEVFQYSFHFPRGSSVSVTSDFSLEDMECTRIIGKLSFFDFPEDAVANLGCINFACLNNGQFTYMSAGMSFYFSESNHKNFSRPADSVEAILTIANNI